MIRVQCPAKINLFLEITGRRKDGYHNLASLMGKINLYDVLEFAVGEDGQASLEIERKEGGVPLSAGPDNLVLRAIEAFREAFGVARGVRAKLIKRIPVGAGLGGGSSDAGGTLAGLVKLFRMKLDAAGRKTLAAVAKSLGADVPFFLHPSPWCLARGIGEKLKPVAFKDHLPYLIVVYPGFPVSTSEAYKNLALPRRADVLTRLGQLDRLINRLKRGEPLDAWKDLLFNRLEESSLPALDKVSWMRSLLGRLGLRGVRMSGSGSTAFGFVHSRAAGEICLKKIKAYSWEAHVTSFCA
jgi:4-diphosphocytidyl-2-C-methyl-D-erythritol kinase